MTHLSNNLKVLRECHNYTQQEIADIIGIDVYEYNLYEHGKEPNHELLLLLADTLAIGVDTLLRVDIGNPLAANVHSQIHLGTGLAKQKAIDLAMKGGNLILQKIQRAIDKKK
jgi:transcriptional regulator with XRE-family HTH domain